MKRREFLQGGVASVVGARRAFASGSSVGSAIHVSPNGRDTDRGTSAAPMRTVSLALQRLLDHSSAGALSLTLHPGTYHLDRTLHVHAEDLRGRSLLISSLNSQPAALSGGRRLSVSWQRHRDSIWQTPVPSGTATDQLFVNGERQVLARYPNFNPSARYLNGSTSLQDIERRSKHWKQSDGAYLHALQRSHWGSLHSRVTGRSLDGKLTLEGGWQIDRDQPIDPEVVFVENVAEELDAAGEWYLDEPNATLHLWPHAGVDLRTAVIEIASLETVLCLEGSQHLPLRDVTVRCLSFNHTLRTFMKTREPLLRSDWRIYRSGAVLMRRTENCTIERCDFDQPGGNALFLDGHNRRAQLSGLHIRHAGASGICIMGRPDSVRTPSQTYADTARLSDIDLTPGPLGADFPDRCRIEDCLIEESGRFEKQSAGIALAMARRVTIRHCSIYGVPRAGINIGDGTWGGHTVEGCDVFDTVLETSDHGAFNSWGRDRWWKLQGIDPDHLLGTSQGGLPLLDTVEPITIQQSRWACTHGWDIDLDDGSTNYIIRQNLCLNGGIKLREGFLRRCENNITVNNTVHPHVWPLNSGDILQANIFFVPYRPVRVRQWGSVVDNNLLHHPGATAAPATDLQSVSRKDIHSLTADAQFLDPRHGNFNVKSTSPALTLGFHNFDQAHFGVTSPRLRVIARHPDTAALLEIAPSTLATKLAHGEHQWLGAQVRDLVGIADVSSLGAPGEVGALIAFLAPHSRAAAAGLLQNDLLLRWNDQPIQNTDALLILTDHASHESNVQLTILRQQKTMQLQVALP